MNEKLTADIKPADRDDLARLIEIGRRTFLQAFSNENKAEDIADYVNRAFSLETLRKELANPDSAFFLLTVGDAVAGYLKLNRGVAQTDNVGDELLEIERIYLLETFKGQGLGKRLMDFALAEAKAAKLSGVWLGVWEANDRAIRFYKSAGFDVVGEHSFMIGSDEQRDLIMRKWL